MAALAGAGARVGMNYLKHYGRQAISGRADADDLQERNASEVFRTFSELKGGPLKLAQMLSIDQSLLPPAYAKQFARAQYSAPPLSYPLVVRTFRREFGKDPREVFDTFEPQAAHAASIGQVHRATRGGRTFAVKIQYPGVAESLRSDLGVVKPIALQILGLRERDVAAYFREVETRLLEETDYEKELANATSLSSACAHLPQIRFPEYHPEFSNRRVITMDWMDGEPFDVFADGPAPQDLRDIIGQALWDFYAHQIHNLRTVHADPHPGNLFALHGVTRGLGHVAYVDFGMMDSISDADRLTLTGAVVHLINRDFEALARDFVTLGFLKPNADLGPIVPALAEVLGGALGENVGNFNFKAITDRFSELMYDYPFRVPARFALIIRAVVSQEGLALRLDPSFRIIGVAYPYVARRLLAGDTAEMREKLLDVLFDRHGRLQIERLENLLAVVGKDDSSPDLLPVAGAGLKLLLGPEGSSLRQRLLLTLVENDHLHTDDLRALVALMGRTFSASKLAGGLLARLNPLAAAF